MDGLFFGHYDKPFHSYAYMRTTRVARLVKEGGLVVAGQVAAVLGALVMVRVLTEYLEPMQYGHLALGLTIGGLVNQVVMGGVAAGIGRFYSIAAEANDLAGYLNASSRLMAYASGAVVAISIVLVAGLLWFHYSQWVLLATAVLVYSVLSGYNASLSAIQNAARQRAVVAFHGGIEAWLKILLAVLVMLWLGASSSAVVLGYIVSSLLVTGSQLFFLRRLIRPRSMSVRHTENWGVKMWSYSLPFSMWGGFTWAQQVSDRWALQTFVSTQEVGLYAVVFQLGYVPVGLATGMAMSFLGPILYQRSGSANDKARNESVHRIAWSITGSALLLTAMAFVFTFSFKEWIFSLLVAEKYRSVSYLLPWMVLAGGVFAAGQMLALKLMSEMKPAVMVVAKIVTSVVGVSLNIYGAKQFGLQGVVVALVVTSVIYCFWMSWLAFRPPESIVF